ncbi:MAG: hypothetical protein DWQ01_16030 [Planctomycetota bacterium]|nr:MAG: hypothetical protein DWQ01_16030 [Planctomycetota bacterium]
MAPRHLLLPLLGLVLIFGGVSAAATEPVPGTPQQEVDRVLILGMDGMDFLMAKDWMDQGELPNLAKLRDQGTFAPFMPAIPAQSPVSWASINSGTNPGKHGIYDFIRVYRPNGMPSAGIGFQEETQLSAEEAGIGGGGSLLPYGLMGGGVLVGLLAFLALKSFSSVVAVVGFLAIAAGGVFFGLNMKGEYPESVSTYTKLSRSEEFWGPLDRAGVPFRGQGTIVAYPVNEMQNGKILAGLGAPDAKGGLNTSAVYTTLDKRVRRKLSEKTGEWYDRTYTCLPAYSEEDAPTPTSPSGKSAGTVTFYKMTEKSPGVYESKVFGPRNTVKFKNYVEEFQSMEEAARSGASVDFQELERLGQLTSRGAHLLSTWAPMQVEWKSGDAKVAVTIDGSRQEIPLNSWSEFFEVEFPWTSSYSTHAIVRVWPELDGEGLELFMTPLQINPHDPVPGTAICWPPDFASQLATDIGYFETLGWACMNMAAKDGQISDQAFLADIESTYTWRKKMLENAMEDDSWKVLFHFFGSPDRVCHALMRHFDPEHPQYLAEMANAEVQFFGKTIQAKDAALEIYKKMDETVAWVTSRMGPNDVLMICSDHGFFSFRRQVSLNNWLAEAGFLKFKTLDDFNEPLTSKDLSKSGLNYVDWSETKAYSMAIGKIYLNRKGREKKGIVSDEEAEQVLEEIEKALMEMVDPATGEKMVRHVYRRDEIYQGPYVEARNSSDPSQRIDGAPELTLDFAPGYRAAWTTTTGGIKLTDKENEDGVKVVANGPYVYDNNSPWSGDHCGMDLDVLQGVFFSSKPMTLTGGTEKYDARHIAPTVLSLMGVDIPEDYDLPPLQLQ